MGRALNTWRDCDLSDVAVRVHAEYREMPGLRLTAGQAQRLWNLDRERCEAVLRVLIDAGVLKRTADGSFILV